MRAAMHSAARRHRPRRHARRQRRAVMPAAPTAPRVLGRFASTHRYGYICSTFTTDCTQPPIFDISGLFRPGLEKALAILSCISAGQRLAEKTPARQDLERRFKNVEKRWLRARATHIARTVCVREPRALREPSQNRTRSRAYTEQAIVVAVGDDHGFSP